MPNPLCADSFKRLCEKFNAITTNENRSQIFSIEHNLYADETMFSNDEIPGLGIVFHAKVHCRKGEIDDDHYLNHRQRSIDYCKGCYNPVTLSIYMMNSGVEFHAEFDIGIKMDDKSIKSIYKKTRVLLKNEKICCSSERGDLDEYLSDGVMKFILTIKNAKPVVLSFLPK